LHTKTTTNPQPTHKTPAASRGSVVALGLPRPGCGPRRHPRSQGGPHEEDDRHGVASNDQRTLPATNHRHGTEPGKQWISSWATAPHATPPFDSGFAPPFAEGFDNQTVRNIVHASVGGSAVRVRLTNAYGTQSVFFSAVYIGLVATGAALVPGSNRALTFKGSPSAVIPAGADLLSDPLPLQVPPDSDLAVSLFADGPTGTPTIHAEAMQTTYVSTGDVAASEDGSSFAAEASSWYFVRGLDVLASPRVKGTVVAIGDSITDGFGSTPDRNRRWPDYLARRLMSGAPGLEMSVVNAGIGANRVLTDSPCFGPSAVHRVETDALGQTGVRFVILTEGITDIGFPVYPFPFVCLDPMSTSLSGRSSPVTNGSLPVCTRRG